MADYERRYRDQSTRLTRLRKGLPDTSGVGALDDVRADADAGLSKAAAALAGSDPDRAKTLLDSVETLLDETLPGEAADWAGRASALLKVVETAPVPERAILTGLADEAKVGIYLVDRDGAAPALFDHANAALPLLQRVIRELRNDMQTTVSRVVERIGSMNGPPTTGELGKRLNTFTEVAAESRAGRREDLEQMVTGFGSLREELYKQVTAHTPRARNEAEELFEQGHPLEALEAPAPEQARERGVPPAQVSETVERQQAPAPPSRQASAVLPPPATGAAPHVPEVQVLASSGVNFVATVIVHLVRIILLTALFSLIGWVAFHEQFVGTTEELVGIFLWAFTTDVTIETVSQMAVARRANPPEASTTTAA